MLEQRFLGRSSCVRSRYLSIGASLLTDLLALVSACDLHLRLLHVAFMRLRHDFASRAIRSAAMWAFRKLAANLQELLCLRS